jgi:tRNA nucleotidyltransferase/poly(A) polymerase
MGKIIIPEKYEPITRKISSCALKNGFEVYIVGGFVRDLYLAREPKDLDVMVEDKNKSGNAAAGIEFSEILAREHNLSAPVVFERFGTAKLFFDGEEVEFVMPRKEYYDENSRNPDTEIGSLEQDALRRDFTVNALFLRLSDMEVLDLTRRGLGDIENRIIRVTDPDSADIIFSQDPLRILRAVRQSLQLGFSIESGTFNALAAASSRIGIVAPERIREEINKILLEKKPSEAFQMMRETGLLKEILPELEKLAGLQQPLKYHDDDVLNHTLKVTDRTHPDLLLRIAALLHDTGKLETFKEYAGKISFHGHEKCSSAAAENILKRLKYPKDFTQKIVNIIKNHMYPKMYEKNWGDAAVRRFAGACGAELDYVMELSCADFGKDSPDNKISEFAERINDLKNKNLLYPKDDFISGKELMDHFGLKQGAWIQKAKNVISDAMLENPSLTKEEAFSIVKEMLKKGND